MQYPKLVIITPEDVFTTSSSASFTIRSFLKYWAPESVFQIVCGDFNVNGSGFVRDNCYVLCHDDIHIVSKLISANRRGKSNVSTGQIQRLYKKNGVKEFLRRHIEALYKSFSYKLSMDLKNHLLDFHPVAIYSYCVDYRGVILTQTLARYFNVPVFPHFMDDWPSIYFKNTIYFKATFNRKLKRLIKNAPACFCISDYMSLEYSHRYGNKNMISLMHSVPLHYIDSYKKQNNEENIWLYAGSLYLNRYKTLIEIGKQLNYLGKIKDKIHLYCPQVQWEELKECFEETPNIIYKGFMSQTDLMSEIYKADMLLLIECFDDEMLEYTRLSLSTKVPEYLSSGKPIFAVGNLRQGSIQYLFHNKAAFVAGQIEDIRKRIVEMTDNSLVQNVLSNALNLFKQNHVQEKQIEKFYSIIENNLK